MKGKKSFVLYFDMHRSIRELSADQRGELLSALFEFAEQAAEWDNEEIIREEVLSAHPEMGPAAAMAFSFMAETIWRDTAKWREKHLRYREAAEKRWESRVESPYFGRDRIP